MIAITIKFKQEILLGTYSLQKLNFQIIMIAASKSLVNSSFESV